MSLVLRKWAQYPIDNYFVLTVGLGSKVFFPRISCFFTRSILTLAQTTGETGFIFLVCKFLPDIFTLTRYITVLFCNITRSATENEHVSLS